MKSVNSRLGIICLIILFIISIWSLWPVVKKPSTSVTDTWDGLFIVWQVNQTIEKIPYDLKNIFEGNIFYPYRHVKAYSDLFVPSALIAYLPVKLTGESVVATSIMLILGQLTVSIVLFFWFREMSKNDIAALLGTVAFLLSQIRLHYQVHLQMWVMQWALLSMWMIWKYSKSGKIRFLYISGGLLAVQIWESLLPAYFILGFYSIVFLSNPRKFLVNWKHILFVGLVVFVLVFPVIRVYKSISLEFDYVRPIREVAHFSGSLDDIWTKFASPGLYILAVISLYRFVKMRERKDENIFLFIKLIIISLIMYLGPVLKWGGETVKIFKVIPIPLPYTAFYYLMPGFDALRTPSRWMFMVAFALAVIITLCFKGFKLKKRKDILVFSAIFIIAILGGVRVKNTYLVPSVTQYPKVYSFVENLPRKVILELPAYTWGAGSVAAKEAERMLYSLKHRKYLINGVSGFTPPEREKFANDLWTDFPSLPIDNKLKELGVDYLIVHKNEYSEEKLKEIESWGKSMLIWEDETTEIYQVKMD